MEKKPKISTFISDTGKVAKDILGKSKEIAVHTMDQNNDRKFDLTDVSEMANAVSDAAKKSTQVIKNSLDEKARQLELKTLRPIFPETLDDAAFLMPKFVRITERDKKHAESDVCRGSLGYMPDQKGLYSVVIFQDSVDAFGLTFYPDRDCEFYYVDPCDRDRYIALDDYFGYLKVARINDLQKLAQDLGAKHFKVTYKEERTSFSERKGTVHIKSPASVDAAHSSTEKKYSTVEIAAEMTFPGHDPVKPQLKYMQRDPSIQTLVSMRMDKTAPLLHQKYMLKMSNSSGLKESDAVKIDAVLKSLKCSGNATVYSEAKNESRRYLEYEIDF